MLRGKYSLALMEDKCYCSCWDRPRRSTEDQTCDLRPNVDKTAARGPSGEEHPRQQEPRPRGQGHREGGGAELRTEAEAERGKEGEGGVLEPLVRTFHSSSSEKKAHNEFKRGSRLIFTH